MKKIIKSLLIGSTMLVLNALLTGYIEIIEFILVSGILGLLYYILEDNDKISLFDFFNSIVISISISLLFRKFQLNPVQFATFLTFIYILLFVQIILFKDKIVDKLFKKVVS